MRKIKKIGKNVNEYKIVIEGLWKRNLRKRIFHFNYLLKVIKTLISKAH